MLIGRIGGRGGREEKESHFVLLVLTRSHLCHLVSLGFTWMHMVSHGLTSSHMVSLGLTWFQLVSHGLTWSPMVSHSFTLSHTDDQAGPTKLGLKGSGTCTHKDSQGIRDSQGLARMHRDPQGL